ncbi:FYN-binding protein 1-like [Neolamprologus brichardi]|uniref:FYN-binding protein 1-like n=1 Tax=Neolamprologus brichardi TaxID=32507 RepID=UPI0016438A0C|nr:FYN-binding protein 1-like [Neolamprologus brichardi]
MNGGEHKHIHKENREQLGDTAEGNYTRDKTGRTRRQTGGEAAEQKQEKKKEKEDKEEKKRQEAEKKKQKEREKKEQEARKRFKLVGPLEVLQKGKASTDCRSSKTDLGLKQGDPVDIIRVQGNPEGKWLGRAQDGSSRFTIYPSIFSLSRHLPL